MAREAQVVIAGGGPVGLFLACELRLAGVEVAVLERRPERGTFTKGFAMHARTMELLAMRGMAGAFLDGGVRVPGWQFGFLENRVDFTTLDSPYPFVLSFPQDRTEAILEERARAVGALVVRGQQVTGLEQDDHGVRVRASGGEWRADWLVGADGGASVVRQAAGIGFPGLDARFFAYAADVVADDPPAPGFNRVNEHGAMMVVPMPGGLVRIAGYDAADQEPGRLGISMDDLRGIVGRIAGADFGVHDPRWLTRFGSTTRLADAYRKGRVLLAGDAAHLHFPAGGVGLNLGLQDAMNLGWKLAAVVRGRAPEDLLDTYGAERRPWGDDVARHTLAQTALITATTAEVQALRGLLSDLIATVPEMSLKLARRLAALDVRYPGTDPAAHPLTGGRVPELGDHLRDGRAVLVTPPGGSLPAAAGAAARLGVRLAVGPVSGLDLTAALVRPDGYLWWATNDADPDRAACAALERVGVRFSGGASGSAGV
jgi:2-polyprenyl-6-methoxyphenol hydroxylase-like FAD-dependent oxidoreductase